jgi:hypothetical protein
MCKEKYKVKYIVKLSRLAQASILGGGGKKGKRKKKIRSTRNLKYL